MDVVCSLGRRRAHAKQGGMRFRSLCFQNSESEHKFWQLLPAPVIGSRVCRLPPLSAEEWSDKKIFDEKSEVALPHGVVMNAEEESTRETFLTQAWRLYVDDAFDFD